MEGDMEFKKAPQAHLDTWNNVTKLVFWSSIGVVVLLILMAATLL